MSHFTTVRVEIKNGDILHQTLQELGYTVELQTVVRGYNGNIVQADYVVRQANGYDLGFRQAGTEYELVADFWGAKVDPQTFIQTLMQPYAHNILMSTVAAQGFTVETEEVLADGTVRVVVGRWT